MLGSSLDQMHREERKDFNQMTLLLVVDKMLDRIRDIHDRFVIHRDLKPENFLVKDLPLQFLDPIYSTSKSKKSSADKKQQIFTNNSKMM